MTKKNLFLSALIIASSVCAQNVAIKVACVGNSITEGFGTANSSSWPNQLDARLGDEYYVRNFGIGGRTLLKNGDFPYWDEAIFDAAREFEPDIVIILLGTNDSKPQNWAYKVEFYPDYVDMVNVFRDLSSEPEIFVGFPPPVFEDGFGINNAIIRNEIIPLIDSVRASQKTFHINFYDNMTEMGDLFPDGIHPNAAGYTEMAQIAEQAIRFRPSGYIRYFAAHPDVIEEGGSTILYWETSAGSEVMLDGQPVDSKDSLSISPNETTKYTLTASGELNDTSMVTVSFLPSGIIKTFYADPPVLETGTGDSTKLVWQTTNNSQVWLNGNSVNQNDSIIVKPEQTLSFNLTTDGVVKEKRKIMVSVLDASEINRSLMAAGYNASSTEYQYQIQSAFDGDTSTYWFSEGHLTEWISLDLGREIYINRIMINWGDVYAPSYRIEVLDEENKLTIFNSTTTSDGDIDDFSREEIKGKQVRLLCFKSSSTTLGYMVKEIEIYGSAKSFQQIAPGGINHLPMVFSLLQNAPNPFNPVTTIRYTLASPSLVHLELFDIKGSKITELVDQHQPAGEYSVRFDGSALSSGIYFYRLRAESWENIKRMLILK